MWINNIEDAIVLKLQNAFPDIDRFTDEISRQSDKQFFIDIFGISEKTDGANHTQKFADMDIVYKDKNHSQENYHQIAEMLDGLFRPVFYFKNRALTVDKTNISIVDEILHFTFSISYRDSIAEKAHGQMMENIKLNLGR
ncbi:MAG: hypothetical protein RR827_06825 [Oscillospiraceae bacterium]